MKIPAVFLDRDGVINRTTVRDGIARPPDNVSQVEILPGVSEALRLLESAGLPRIVVTNQPDIARGTQSRGEVDRINQFLCTQLPITACYVCAHDTPDNCSCRKPKPGLLIQAADEHAIELSNSFMVGDRWSDIEAGRAAGCRTFLIKMPWSQPERCKPDAIVADLLEAVQAILIAISRDHWQ